MNRIHLVKKINMLKHEKRSIQAELDRLKRRVLDVIKTKGHVLSYSENEELLQLVEQYTSDVLRSYPDETSTQRLFWDQQLKYAKLKNKSAMRWHPMMVKWCLYLRSKSQKAYNVARDSGFIALPSTRTLFDYSHVLPSTCGFHERFTEHLIEQAEKCGMYKEEWKSYVGILQDEIKVSEGLVYDKKSGELVGYVELDKTGNDISNMENLLIDSDPKLAKSILVVMVRGITTSLKYPFFCLATDGITSATLYPPIWETVRILTIECGLKPLFITCDGATPNRKFFKLHRDENLQNTFWTLNPYSFPTRKLYFISDVPHLLKTTRNCFSNSGAHNLARNLWKSGKCISWTHIIRLYEDHVETPLFTLCPKLTRHHVHLSSFAKMKVNLAAQVLSKTVADALEELYGDHVTETVKFIRHMNRFFDCLNTRHLEEAKRKRNPDLEPYRTQDDSRFHYLTDEFLQYFNDWEVAVMNRAGQYTLRQRTNMKLSQQTLNGLHISVNSIVECTKFLLHEGASFVLTHRFNQDPLEEHFAHYRHKGGSNDNPTVFDVRNTLSELRVIGSQALAPIRGNVSKKRQQGSLAVDNTPLAKRMR
ncbi:uncharacterized protein LOC124262759 [Haliotis rubra]|uniref:uncharacterized protein LOC124262759 n=1 Tax=Haliotis rubra TaxID=36100 RepID=UPI001EE5BAD5|nr:uncharacterized protein LOC124262759 [Haliotis rubra]